MQIKKYCAPTLKEATHLMKQEFGPEAIILGTRTISDQSDTRKVMYEITAGLESFEFKKEIKEKAKSVAAKSTSKFSDELEKISAQVYNSGNRTKDKIKEIYNQPSETHEQKQIEKSSIELRMKKIFSDLTDREVQKSVILSIMEQLKKYQNFLSEENIENYAITSLSSLILTKEFDMNIKNKCKVVSLVGPTGVGKTTTIAKLALIAKIIHKLDVGLISIDTYRLGAVDQLRSFADVSHTDFLVAYEPNDMQKIMKKFAKKDIVFIDTVGRSPKNSDQLQTNQDFLSRIKVDETYLVLSATNSIKNLIEASNKFKMFDFSSFILTKVDEAVVHGNIVNLITKTGKPVSFLTNGQVIPDDILAADSDFIAKLIFTNQLRS
ncbi:MAG: flagellar biosynthesis protein FlhF [Ignavibacteriaceae bacterium]|nr:flagellar biosynthesis protein FlhF [Ignavibacteriaceae bacterium]